MYEPCFYFDFSSLFLTFLQKYNPTVSYKMVGLKYAVIYVVVPTLSYSGMLPCFLGGLLSFLLRLMSSAWMRRMRVSQGEIISSM